MQTCQTRFPPFYHCNHRPRLRYEGHVYSSCYRFQSLIATQPMDYSSVKCTGIMRFLGFGTLHHHGCYAAPANYQVQCSERNGAMKMGVGPVSQHQSKPTLTPSSLSPKRLPTNPNSHYFQAVHPQNAYPGGVYHLFDTLWVAHTVYETEGLCLCDG